MIEFLEELDGRVPNLAGVKYTDENLMDYALCLEHGGGRYDMLYGRDELFACALFFGATGAIGSTFNFAAPLYNGIIASYAAGDFAKAKELQGKSHVLIRTLFGQGVPALPAQKEVMRELGIDCGDARLPFLKTTADERKRIAKALESVGFSENEGLFCA
jgi:N-acetylneuraminate lyase